MNRRMAEKILIKTHLNFINSIEDEVVRKLVDKNSIISGGAIVSLLLNESISDFDYYFTNKETTLAVAQYYVNKFNGLNSDKKIIPYVENLENRIKINVKSAGAISETIDDSKYQYFEFLPDEYGTDYVEKLFELTDEISSEPLKDIKPKYRPIFISSNAITLSNKIQLVIRFYGNPEEIHKNYDFTHCCNYWLSEDKKLYLNKDALESILTKNLFYQGSLYPVCSVIRTRKFMKKGWYINAGQLLKMMFQISELDLNNINILEEQLTGVDAAYFHQVIKYCKEKQEESPEFKITTPYLISIIDKIFG